MVVPGKKLDTTHKQTQQSQKGSHMQQDYFVKSTDGEITPKPSTTHSDDVESTEGDFKVLPDDVNGTKKAKTGIISKMEERETEGVKVKAVSRKNDVNVRNFEHRSDTVKSDEGLEEVTLHLGDMNGKGLEGVSNSTEEITEKMEMLQHYSSMREENPVYMCMRTLREVEGNGNMDNCLNQNGALNMNHVPYNGYSNGMPTNGVFGQSNNYSTNYPYHYSSALNLQQQCHQQNREDMSMLYLLGNLDQAATDCSWDFGMNSTDVNNSGSCDSYHHAPPDPGFHPQDNSLYQATENLLTELYTVSSQGDDSPPVSINMVQNPSYCDHSTSNTSFSEHNSSSEFVTFEIIQEAVVEKDNKFECKICKKSYQLKNALQRHVKKEHYPQHKFEGEEEFPCPFCERTYMLKTSLLRHYRVDHPQMKSRKRKAKIVKPPQRLIDALDEIRAPGKTENETVTVSTDNTPREPLSEISEHATGKNASTSMTTSSVQPTTDVTDGNNGSIGLPVVKMAIRPRLCMVSPNATVSRHDKKSDTQECNLEHKSIITPTPAQNKQNVLQEPSCSSLKARAAKKSALNHLRKGKSEVSEFDLTCYVCGNVYSRKDTVTRHLRFRHNIIRPRGCRSWKPQSETAKLPTITWPVKAPSNPEVVNPAALSQEACITVNQKTAVEQNENSTSVAPDVFQPLIDNVDKQTEVSMSSRKDVLTACSLCKRMLSSRGSMIRHVRLIHGHHMAKKVTMKRTQPRSPKVPRPPKAPKSPKTRRSPKAPGLPKTPISAKAPRSPKVPRTSKAPRSPKSPRSPKKCALSVVTAPSREGLPCPILTEQKIQEILASAKKNKFGKIDIYNSKLLFECMVCNAQLGWLKNYHRHMKNHVEKGHIQETKKSFVFAGVSYPKNPYSKYVSNTTTDNNINTVRVLQPRPVQSQLHVTQPLNSSEDTEKDTCFTSITGTETPALAPVEANPTPVMAISTSVMANPTRVITSPTPLITNPTSMVAKPIPQVASPTPVVANSSHIAANTVPQVASQTLVSANSLSLFQVPSPTHVVANPTTMVNSETDENAASSKITTAAITPAATAQKTKPADKVKVKARLSNSLLNQRLLAYCRARKSIECFYCKNTFSRVYGLQRHIRNHVAKGDLNEKTICNGTLIHDQNPSDEVRKIFRYSCPTCRMGFVYYSSMEEHIKREHLFGQSSMPQDSTESCVGSGDLKEVTLLGENEETDPIAVKVADSQVTRYLKKQTSLRPSEERIQLSPSTRRKPRLSPRHMQPAGVHACLMCDAVFCEQSMLQRHELMHLMHKTVMCKFCGEGLTSVTNVKEHVEMKHNSSKVQSHPLQKYPATDVSASTSETTETGSSPQAQPRQQTVQGKEWKFWMIQFKNEDSWRYVDITNNRDAPSKLTQSHDEQPFRTHAKRKPWNTYYGPGFGQKSYVKVLKAKTKRHKMLDIYRKKRIGKNSKSSNGGPAKVNQTETAIRTAVNIKQESSESTETVADEANEENMVTKRQLRTRGKPFKEISNADEEEAAVVPRTTRSRTSLTSPNQNAVKSTENQLPTRKCLRVRKPAGKQQQGRKDTSATGSAAQQAKPAKKAKLNGPHLRSRKKKAQGRDGGCDEEAGKEQLLDNNSPVKTRQMKKETKVTNDRKPKRNSMIPVMDANNGIKSSLGSPKCLPRHILAKSRKTWQDWKLIKDMDEKSPKHDFSVSGKVLIGEELGRAKRALCKELDKKTSNDTPRQIKYFRKEKSNGEVSRRLRYSYFC